jgi:uncharacterized protein with PhoU and TrkA domain
MINFVNGNMVLSGAVTVEELEEAFDLVKWANGYNEKIVKRAEALAKVVIEQDGVIPAIKEVLRYVKSTDYQTLGGTFGLKEAKEIVDRIRQA